ncbi:adult cuticle protein 1-like [Toxorhynchites rutilus septentrionalis]|uniref:adult cuticle protein 1-like n=1 Tax=Toxorhynchites rutilus septentrionalis TaxID=329112 RepID=UPI00247A57A7|nr:adult cuticle protein 1-like [Toxorhynchites rutilus septentrionalis]
MKCIAAVVMMALAVVAKGSAVTYSVPLAYSAPHTTVVQQNVAPRYIASLPVTSYAASVPVTSYAASVPIAYAAPHTTVVQSNGAPQYTAPIAYAAAPALAYSSLDSEVVEATQVVAPAATVVAQPAVNVIAQPAVAVVAQKEARYVAANPGAVHDAPLAGHAISQQSLNLEPAAGTL